MLPRLTISQVQIAAVFIEFAVTGQRLTGGLTSNRLISPQAFISNWNRPDGLPPNQGFFTQSINNYTMDALGSNRGFNNFVPLRADLNSMKGRLFGLQVPQSIENLQARARSAAAGNIGEYNALLTILQTVYHLDTDVLEVLADSTISSLQLLLT
jgi:hypothetical protein